MVVKLLRTLSNGKILGYRMEDNKIEIEKDSEYTREKTFLNSLTKTKTNRGFGLFDFKDKYGRECSLQDSSLASEPAIWFGIDNANPKILKKGSGWVPFSVPDDVHFTTRMHLTQEQVKALLPILTYFAETGEYVRDYKDETS